MSQQQQPKALKFDELAGDVGTSYNETDRIVQERVDRYAAEAARQRGKIKYLVHYRARVRKGSNDWNTSYGWATRAKHAVASLGKVYDDREILVVDGGVRGNETLEFWFVPKGVDLPKPSPEFERSDAIDCPEVIAYQDGHNFDRTSPIVFTARAGEGGADSFDWSFSDGKIIGKNGGSRVEVDVTTAKTDRVTAFLEVRGLPIPCENTAVAVAEFGKTPRLVERFGLLPNGHIRALLDAFLNTLHQHSNFRGYVYIYGDRKRGKASLELRRRLIANHFHFRDFDRSRITIVDAGYRETISTDIWLVPPGVEPPDATPTVNDSFVIRPAVRKSTPRK